MSSFNNDHTEELNSTDTDTATSCNNSVSPTSIFDGEAEAMHVDLTDTDYSVPAIHRDTNSSSLDVARPFPESVRVSQDSMEPSLDILCRDNEKTGKKIKLSVALLKEEIKDYKSALKDEALLTDENVEKYDTVLPNFKGLLLFKKEPLSRPLWIEQLQDYLSENGHETTLPGKSKPIKSGLLFLENEGRRFVFIFGQGRHLLKESTREPLFGLKVALNNLDLTDRESIKSFATKTFGINPVHISTHYGRGTFPHHISLDPFKRLTKVEGRNKKRGSRISSEGPCAVTRQSLTVEDYPLLCSRLFQLSQKERYKEILPGVENLIPEEDEGILMNLNGILLKTIQGQDNSQWYFSHILSDDFVPDESAYYTLSVNSVNLSGPHSSLDEVATVIMKLPNLTQNKLTKMIKLHSFNEDGQEDVERLYKYIVFETRIKEQLYLLNGGNWYRVDSNFNQIINQQINPYFQTDSNNLGLTPVLDIDFASDIIPNESEATLQTIDSTTDSMEQRVRVEQKYNRRIAEASEGNLLLLDCRTVQGDTSADPYKLNNRFEVCDLLSRQGHLIHVKNWSNSSNFSHLISQGFVSAETLKRDSFVLGRQRGTYIWSNVCENIFEPYMLLHPQLSESLKKLKALPSKIIKSSLQENPPGDLLRDHLVKYIEELQVLDDPVKEEAKNLIVQLDSEFISCLNPIKFEPENYTIVFAFFHHADRPQLSDYLPFFSRVNLSEAIKKISELGYKVEVRQIQRPNFEKQKRKASSSSQKKVVRVDRKKKNTQESQSSFSKTLSQPQTSTYPINGVMEE